MTPPSHPESDRLSLSALRHIDQVCARFEDAWRAGQAPRAEDYLAGIAEPERAALFRELLLAECEHCAEQGVPAPVASYHERFPEYGAVIRAEVGDSAALQEVLDDPSRTQQLQSAPASPAEGNALVPRIPGYGILREIGRGGMGVVYLGRDLKLGRLVALKVILAGPHADPSALARFHAEARTVARLSHPNIVQVYEVGEHEGRPYIALEYVEGGSLADRLAHSPQPPGATARLVETIARAVHAAHEQGIVHRDLKPANILLQEDLTQRRKDAKEDGKDGGGHAPPDSSSPFAPLRLGVSSSSLIPKITDFGLAKQLDAAVEGRTDLRTQTGAVLGTPSYMAPEQARGGTQPLGPAADVYALGVLLYEMLTGRPPFLAADVLGTLEQVCTQEPVPPRRLQARTPRDLETICLKCLQKEPQRRYATAQALAEDLRRFLDGEPILARPVSLAGRGWRWARRKPVLATLVALSTVLALTVAIGSSVAAILLRIEHANFVAERQRRQQRVLESLLNVAPAGVPLLLTEMNDNREVFLPLVQARLEDESLGPNQRLRLAMALTSLGQPRTDDLVKATATAPADECANLAAAFRSLPDHGTSVLREAFDRAGGAVRFRFAVVLLELGDPQAARELLAFKPNPEQRTRFVQQFSGWHGDLAALPEMLRRHDDSALRSGLCAALGRLDPGLLSPPVAAALREALVELHARANDAGTHATAGWALRRWGEERDVVGQAFQPDRQAGKPDLRGKQWYRTPEGLTMIRAEPPGTANGAARPFPWALWVSDREVSLGLFRRFLKDPQLAAEGKPADWPGVNPDISPTDDCPVHNVNFRDMMLFCNWLSRREGRTPCYEPMPGQVGFWTCRYGANGYRVPTNAEWEYACRAGTTTRFFFGDDATLLPEYANVLLTRAEPGGRRLSNDWGLFDTLANEWEWCFDGPRDLGPFPLSTTLTMRGGTYGTGSFYSTCASAAEARGTERTTSHGFRVVYREGQPADAEAAHVGVEMLDRLIAQAPAHRQYLLDRRGALIACANIHVWRGQWTTALTYQARAAEAYPEDHALAFYLAPLLLAVGDRPGYVEHRRRMLQRWGRTNDLQEAERTAKVCSLLEIGDKEGAVVLELAERGVRLAETMPATPQQMGWCRLAEGMALYRCGRHEDAVDRLRAALKSQGMTPDFHVAANLVLAMALHRLERPEDSRAAFGKAASIKVPEEATPLFTPWNDWLICRFLRREAEALLAPKK
jgi:serine/threonine protein kinase/formylglycine-generating enzyme required for sulfatase activity